VTDPASRDPLTRAFADLPRQRSSAQFTQRVLAQLDRRDRRRATRSGRWIWATVTGLLLVSLVAIGYEYQRQQAAKRAYRAQVEELRDRYQTLLDEVATVREEVTTPDTRLYLGGDERVDLVFDWSQSPTYQTGRSDTQDIRPAAYEQ